jgi:hypothetical protein
VEIWKKHNSTFVSVLTSFPNAIASLSKKIGNPSPSLSPAIRQSKIRSASSPYTITGPFEEENKVFFRSH